MNECRFCKYFDNKIPVKCRLGCAMENRNRATINRLIIFQPVNLEYCKQQREKEKVK